MTEPSFFSSRAARITLVMSCLFATTGIVLPYLARWLEVERGLSGAEIGAILSIPQLMRIGIGPLVGFWADGAADRRTPIRMLTIGALSAFAAFFFLAHDFWSLVVLGFAALTMMQSLLPFIEAATLRATAQGKLSYGAARGIGSIAFIVANIAGGVLIARFGLGAVVAWTLAALLTTAASAWLDLGADPAPAETQARGSRARLAGAFDLLRSWRFLLLIFACGFIQCAHAFYYGFSTLVWRGQGVEADAIGLLWAFGVAVEVGFLWSLPAIERRVSPEALILLGAAGGVLRWTALGFAPLGFLLWPLQGLHALTFAAAHVGAMRLIYREAPEASAGLAQTLYASLSGGLLIGGATLLSGVLYDLGGAHGYWAMAALSMIGGGLAIFLLSPPSQPLKP